MRRVLVCEVCETHIGSFDEERLHLPLSPDQFDPLESGFPEPFQRESDWDNMNCPTCHHRAMGWDTTLSEGVRRDRLMTLDGYLVVPDRFKEEPEDEEEEVVEASAEEEDEPVVELKPKVKRVSKPGKKVERKKRGR